MEIQCHLLTVRMPFRHDGGHELGILCADEFFDSATEGSDSFAGEVLGSPGGEETDRQRPAVGSDRQRMHTCRGGFGADPDPMAAGGKSEQGGAVVTFGGDSGTKVFCDYCSVELSSAHT